MDFSPASAGLLRDLRGVELMTARLREEIGLPAEMGAPDRSVQLAQALSAIDGLLEQASNVNEICQLRGVELITARLREEISLPAEMGAPGR